MSCFGHTMLHDCLDKTVIQGYVFDKRRRGRHWKNWIANIVEWVRNRSDPTTRGYTEP